MAKVLIIEARFYEDLADALAKGATAVLDAAGASYDRISVPGVLEIPAALTYAIDAGGYDGFVLLGCVIRGETTHYDIVANESAREIMRLASKHRLAVGNGIQTVENLDQAIARTSPERKDKGGGAAKAALAMIALRDEFGAKPARAAA